MTSGITPNPSPSPSVAAGLSAPEPGPTRPSSAAHDATERWLSARTQQFAAALGRAGASAEAGSGAVAERGVARPAAPPAPRTGTAERWSGPDRAAELRHRDLATRPAPAGPRPAARTDHRSPADEPGRRATGPADDDARPDDDVTAHDRTGEAGPTRPGRSGGAGRDRAGGPGLRPAGAAAHRSAGAVSAPDDDLDRDLDTIDDDDAADDGIDTAAPGCDDTPGPGATGSDAAVAPGDPGTAAVLVATLTQPFGVTDPAGRLGAQPPTDGAAGEGDGTTDPVADLGDGPASAGHPAPGRPGATGRTLDAGGGTGSAPTALSPGGSLPSTVVGQATPATGPVPGTPDRTTTGATGTPVITDPTGTDIGIGNGSAAAAAADNAGATTTASALAASGTGADQAGGLGPAVAGKPTTLTPTPAARPDGAGDQGPDQGPEGATNASRSGINPAGGPATLAGLRGRAGAGGGAAGQGQHPGAGSGSGSADPSLLDPGWTPTGSGTDAAGRSGATEGGSRSGAPDPLWRQVNRALNNLRLTPGGDHELTIRLRPDELGSVVVKVTTGQGGTAVALVAESPEAARQLAGQRHLLAQQLDQGGLRGATIDIGLGQGSPGHQPGDRSPGGAAGAGGTSSPGGRSGGGTGPIGASGPDGRTSARLRGRPGTTSDGSVDLDL